jgi:hypothetical protein
MTGPVKRIHIISILILTIIICGFIYRSSFASYFFQDDWYSLRIANVTNIYGILQFFNPRTNVIYYRPLGMQIPFYLLQKVFGINPVPFHILTFLTHVVNIYLVFILASLILKDNRKSLLVAALYGTSSVHYIPFYWSATYAFVLGPALFFGASILFIMYIQTAEKKFLIATYTAFLVGLFVNEMVIVSPAVWLLFVIFINRCRKILSVIPAFIISGIYAAGRFIFFAPPVHGLYELGIGRNVLTNLKTYLLWSFNWSDKLTEQMVKPFQFSRLIWNSFPVYALETILLTFILFTLFFIFPFVLIVTRRRYGYLSRDFFLTMWFIVGLSPVLLFKEHRFSYYLPISLAALLIIFTSLFWELVVFCGKNFKIKDYVLPSFLVVIWIILTLNVIDFNSQVYWPVNRANISYNLVNQAVSIYHTRKEQEISFFVPDTSENRLSLNNQDGLIMALGSEKIITSYIYNIRSVQYYEKN